MGSSRPQRLPQSPYQTQRPGQNCSIPDRNEKGSSDSRRRNNSDPYPSVPKDVRSHRTKEAENERI